MDNKASKKKASILQNFNVEKGKVAYELLTKILGAKTLPQQTASCEWRDWKNPSFYTRLLVGNFHHWNAFQNALECTPKLTN